MDVAEIKTPAQPVPVEYQIEALKSYATIFLKNIPEDDLRRIGIHRDTRDLTREQAIGLMALFTYFCDHNRKWTRLARQLEKIDANVRNGLSPKDDYAYEEEDQQEDLFNV